MQEFEELALRQGYYRVAGVDEVGRGALAGPVVAAAVVLPQGLLIPGVDDSKKLSPRKREELFDVIKAQAFSIGVGICDHLQVDRINILQATLEAMKLAVLQISPAPDLLLVDGTFKAPVAIPQKTIKKGDGASISIAAASIIAKVTRDRLMVSYDTKYPGYGLAEHKGYGCAAHLAAIAASGPCEIHRKTFQGVKEHLRDENCWF